jgi:hypothetical protein
MAAKRMFSKSITNSSRFLMMPQSSQNLYFHLGMNADDDGFCEHFTIMRMTESKPDDLKILQAKQFLQIFDDQVLLLLDWKENNLIRSDRYTPSKYLEVYKSEIDLISHGIPNDIPVDSIGKVRLGKDSIGKDREEKEPRARFIPPSREEIESFTNENQCHINIDTFIDYYNSNGWKIGKNKMSDWRATVRNWHRRDKDSVKGKPAQRVDHQALEDRLKEYER